VRPASRVVRLTALWLVAVAVSVGWLLLRRRIRPARTLRAVPDLPAESQPSVPRPRAPEPPQPEELGDDLRRIRGIGPTTESALHDLGIRSYRQLATLDDAGLGRVRDAMGGFPQRIEREDWIGQARRLHREKYGEEA
jgi:predicted flap endonuclease-1-like 5' DNA nuclease